MTLLMPLCVQFVNEINKGLSKGKWGGGGRGVTINFINDLYQPLIIILYLAFRKQQMLPFKK